VKRSILTLSLIFCLMLAFLGSPLPAQATVTTVSVEDVPATANPGDTFTATVAISDVTDLNAACFEVVFDHTVLEFDSDSVTDGLINGTVLELFATVEVEDGRWRITEDVHGLGGATGSGYLCKFDFTVIGSAGDSSDINLENGSLSDTEGDYITPDWEGTHVDVVAVDTTPPTITTTSPPTDETNVAIGSDISASFSEAMNQSSAESAFSTSPSVTGSFSWSANTMTFNPSTNLDYGTEYTVTIAGTAEDLAGNGLDGNENETAEGSPTDDYSWSFTTAAEPVPDISINPTSKDFGDVTVGSSSPAQTFTVTNDGTADLVVGTITIAGANLDQFAIQNDSCSGETIAQGNSATLEVVFSPTSTGAKSATLSIPSNDPDEDPLEVSLSGNGVVVVTYYTLTVTCDPTAGGSVSPSGGDYEAGTSVELTAEPAGGYTFGSWSGALTGSANPDTITMNSNKSVTANFVEFSAPTNVDVTAADTGVESIDVSTKDIGEVDAAEMPEDIEAQEAYMVDSTGTGSFTLRFTGITNASNIVVYKVTDSTWTELTATAIDATTVEVTMTVGDPTLVFALPTAPPPVPSGGGVGGTAYLPDKLAILAPWIALGVGIFLVAGIAWLVIRRRRA